MEDVIIIVKNGIPYVVYKSNPSLKIKIIDYDCNSIINTSTDVDSEGNKCIISVE